MCFCKTASPSYEKQKRSMMMMITSQKGKLEIKIFLEQEKSFSEKSIIKYWNLFSNILLMLPVILMAHPSSTAIKDGIHYFSVILATGFLGGNTGGCSSWGVGKQRGWGWWFGSIQGGSGSVLVWWNAVECPMWGMGKKTQLQGKLFWLCCSCSRKKEP